jgi:hypothetical protein
MSDMLSRVVSEARRDWGTREAQRVDWDSVDRRLFARIEREQRAERGTLAPARNAVLKAVVVGLAAAAAIAALIGKTRELRSLDPDRASANDDVGSIVGIDGVGEVLVGGRRAAVGATLKLGDVIEARGAQATVGRTGKLTLIVESGSTATVTHVQGAFVLALSQGAVEAQVVPVAVGEAFAVDVGQSRVAAHGTHLRVSRAGRDVAVDLNEGSVSVGASPRVGSTWGALVTAPAHAEFTTDDAQGTLRVTHDPSTVRAPAAVGSTAQRRSTTASSTPAVPGPSKSEAQVTQPPSPSTLRAEPRLAANPSAASQPTIEPNADDIVASAVRACMAERLHADGVSVVVSTTLHLQLNDDGSVHSGRFEPPVAPDVNTCAAQSIYKTRFTHGGAAIIPVSFKN